MGTQVKVKKMCRGAAASLITCRSSDEAYERGLGNINNRKILTERETEVAE
jgi:hypothetical protein